MNRLALRTWAAEVTGRYDLVGSAYVDNGMDKYITAGQRFLDKLFDFPRGYSSVFNSLSAGTWYHTFTNNRSIKNVFMNNSEGRDELTKKDRIWLMNKYPSLVSATDQGTPLYWAPANLRTESITDQDALGSFFRYVVAVDETYNGVIFLPPPDEAMVLEVFGQFYTEEFAGEDKTTWWSTHHPNLLVWAAAYMIEVSYRNREGAKDWLEAIQFEAQQIDFDTIETEISGVDQIEG